MDNFGYSSLQLYTLHTGTPRAMKNYGTAWLMRFTDLGATGGKGQTGAKWGKGIALSPLIEVGNKFLTMS